MPKETTTKTFSSCCNDCDTNGCCHNNFHGGSPQSVVLRWLLGLLILAITFVIGLKIGEFKAGMWDQGFGPGMGNMHYQMMQGWNDNPPFPPTMMQPSWGVPESGSGVANPDTTAPIKPVPQKKTTTPNTTK